MEISILKLTELLVNSFILGIILALIYDVNRIFRMFFGISYTKRKLDSRFLFSKSYNEREVKSKKLNEISVSTLIIMQDLLISALSGIGIIILNYYYNDGKIRLFSIFACTIGFVIYNLTLGKLVIIISEPIVLFVRMIIYRLARIFFLPISLLGKIIKSILIKISKQVKKYLAKKLNLRYNISETKRLLTLSKIGFINIKEFKYEG